MSEEPGIRYPGEPYRPPYLEKVAKNLNHNLKEQIPDSVPDEMHHILCMFEEYQGTAEWDRLGCDRWLSSGPGPDKLAELEENQSYRMTLVSFPESFCRQRDYQFWIDPDTETSPISEKDSTFIVRKGLNIQNNRDSNNPDAISFEDKYMNDYYLRHAGYTCQSNKVDGSHLFDMDASFNPIKMPDGTYKFQSVNYPDYLLSHDGNNRVKIMRYDNPTDTNTVIEDAQWIMTKI